MIYHIAQNFNVVIAYGDMSGLNEEEERAFDEWEKTLPNGHHVVITDEEPSWGKCDITGYDSELIEVVLFHTGYDIVVL
jgi:hypothetical protein